MTSIKLIVTGATARAEVDGELTSGMVGIPVTIEYDSAWDGLAKNLVCRSTSGGTRVQANVGKTSTVPHEVMVCNEKLYYVDKLEIGVEGRNSDGTLVIPTVWADCGRINAGANSDADPSADPTPPIWAQLEQSVESLSTEKAPKNHASTDTAYGAGSGSNYGHVKLSDATNSTSGVNGGVAATPAAVKAAYDLANGKANASHGNHVPATQTANNATYLRNDNTWHKVTPSDIGASATGHKHSKSEISDFPDTEPFTFTYEDGSTRIVEVYVK